MARSMVLHEKTGLGVCAALQVRYTGTAREKSAQNNKNTTTLSHPGHQGSAALRALARATKARTYYTGGSTMHLYLVQHGEATSADENQDRPLTESGRAAVAAVAGRLAEAGVHVPTVWHSGKLRAHQTADILAEHLNHGAHTIQRDGLSPKDPVGRIASVIRKLEDDVMIVGHLPHLDSLASLLLARDDQAGLVHFQNAGVLCLAREPGTNWKVEWYLPPTLVGVCAS